MMCSVSFRMIVLGWHNNSIINDRIRNPVRYHDDFQWLPDAMSLGVVTFPE